MLPDGSGILFSDGNSGVQILTLGTERRVTDVMRSPPTQSSGFGVISPDRRWLAYVASDRGSTWQVFVSPFPHAVEARTPVSTAGGTQPRWSPDGRELFFIGSDGILMSAPIHTSATVSAGVPTRVLQRAYYHPLGVFARPFTYDVSPDGRRFLMLKPVTGPDRPVEPATVIVVRHWVEELRQLVPTRH